MLVQNDFSQAILLTEKEILEIIMSFLIFLSVCGFWWENEWWYAAYWKMYFQAKKERKKNTSAYQ